MNENEEVVIEEVVVEEIVVIEREPLDYEIVVNGERHVLQHDEVRYEHAIDLAFPTPPSPDARFTVTFRGAKRPHEGSLKPGGVVEVHEHGAVFNVTATTKS